MKTTAFLIFYAGVLISLNVRVLASERVGDESQRKAKAVKENIPPSRPTFPLFMLPSFSFPGLNIPYLQALSPPNRMTSPQKIQATKTEYMEVTRRQTVHPICYTAYEPKSPCLPYTQSNFGDDDYENFEFDSAHQTHESFAFNEIQKRIESTPTLPTISTQSPAAVREEQERSAKYLEFKARREKDGLLTSSRIEGSEFFPSLLNFPHRQTTEYHTKTVLITKLEKYTDRRVTATMVALNCLPMDRSIPLCQSYPNPIREAPDRRVDDVVTESIHVTQQIVLPEDETKIVEVTEFNTEEPHEEYYSS